MATLYIDTEFNGFQGELISMALVDERGQFWYRSLGCEAPTPWVAENVMPVLGIAPTSRREMQTSLQQFLAGYSAVHIVADWPEDIEHFMAALITGPGQRIDTPPLTVAVRRDLNSAKSAIPHNALADAIAICQAAQPARDESGMPMLVEAV